MAYIKTLKDNELIGGQDNTDVYPITTSQAIFRQNPNGGKPAGVKQRLEDTLQDHEDDAKELHRKAEKLVVYLTNDKANQTLEITGNSNSISLTGTANLETFGDEPSESISPEEMSIKHLKVARGESIIYDNDGVTATINIPNIVGSYTATFTCSYGGVLKSIDSTTNINLRKYFGFAVEQPTDVTELGTSSFSNSVGGTVTIPATSSGFCYIYFAVPENMNINRVVQPDALNAPLAITSIGTITRNIDGIEEPFIYKLYRSTEEIDSTASKRLTIS